MRQNTHRIKRLISNDFPNLYFSSSFSSKKKKTSKLNEEKSREMK